MRFDAMSWVGLILLGLVGNAGPETTDVAKSRSATETQTDHKTALKPPQLIHYAQSRVIAFSPDGKTVASGGGFVCLHDLTTGRLLWRARTDFKQQETCAFLVFSPDGRYLAAAYKGGFIGSPDYVVLWEVAPGRKLQKQRILFARPRGDNDLPTTVHNLSFSPDSKTIVSGSPDRTIYLWDTPTGKELRHFKGGVTAAFASDGRSLACVNHDGTIRRRQITTGDLVNDRKQAAPRDFIYVQQAAFSPDGRRLALCDEYTLSLKDVETGEVITRIDFQGDAIGSVDFTPDSQTLAVVTRGEHGLGGFIRFIDANTGLERSDFKTTREWTGSLAFSCNGHFIAFGENNALLSKNIVRSFCKLLGLYWEENVVRIQDLAVVLKSAEKPTHEAKTQPGKGVLQAEIIANQQTYECNLGGRTAEEFSDRIGSGNYPPGPRVNLIFKLRNVSNQNVTLFNPDRALSSLYLFGPGAMNLPLYSHQTGVGPGGPPPEYLALAPGDSFSFPVTELSGEWDSSRYWLTPGEYTIRACYFCCVSPAPEGASMLFDSQYGCISVCTAPLKINVVASK